MATCKTHDWTTVSLPCPWLGCPNGSRGLWVVIGKARTVYVRRRTKNEWGPLYYWEKTDVRHSDLLHLKPNDDESEDIVF